MAVPTLPTKSDPKDMTDATPFTGAAYVRFLMLALCVALLVLSFIFAINALVDPLWYFGGDRLADRNYAFDERTSKATRFSNDNAKPECVLFGSSTGTLMNNAKLFTGIDCMNMSFSAGRPKEIQAFATWMAKRGERPKVVVLDLDASTLVPAAAPLSIPQFVLNGEAAPSALVPYISVATLVFSLKTLAMISPQPRYYDEAFRSKIEPSIKRYNPDGLHAFDKLTGPFSGQEDVKTIETIRTLWPEARLQCYAPPITVDFIKAIVKNGTIGSYARAITVAAKSCRSLYDFSIPSKLTADPAATYDGLHFTPKANLRIAKVMAGNGDLPPFQIGGWTATHYEETMLRALDVVDSQPSVERNKSNNNRLDL